MAKMIQESKGVAALLTSIRTSWKVEIYYIIGALLILNLAPLYIAGSVIKATGIVEFEDGLKIGTSLWPETAFRGSALCILQVFYYKSLSNNRDLRASEIQDFLPVCILNDFISLLDPCSQICQFWIFSITPNLKPLQVWNISISIWIYRLQVFLLSLPDSQLAPKVLIFLSVKRQI